MAESMRRSEVKKFVHKTKHPKAMRPVQPSLFENALNNVRQEWDCMCSSEVIPSDGSAVLVQVCPGKNPNILWGNQIVGEITDVLGNEITDAVCASAQGGDIAAKIISNKTAHGQFTVRFETSQ